MRFGEEVEGREAGSRGAGMRMMVPIWTWADGVDCAGSLGFAWGKTAFASKILSTDNGWVPGKRRMSEQED